MEDNSFRELFHLAQKGDKNAISTFLEIFRPMIYKNSFVDGCFDQDCFQELSIRLLHCIKVFRFTDKTDVYQHFRLH